MSTHPVPPKRPHIHREHGIERDDPYYWLRDRNDPEVLAHLEAENAWTEAALGALTPLRRQLYDEMLSRIQESDQSPPSPSGPWSYYSRTLQGKAYPIYCRRPTVGGDEQILLDVNEVGRDQRYIRMGMIETSPDHQLLAYAVDTKGDERNTIRIRDLSSGLDTGEEIRETASMLAWGNDSRTLWWCAFDSALRTYRVYCHTLGTPQDVLVYEEPDERFRISIERTRSGRFLIINIGNQSTTESRLVPADRPTQTPSVVQPRQTGCKYHVSSAGDLLLVRTNTEEGGSPAINYRLVQRQVRGDGLLGPSVERIAHRADTELIRVEGFATHAVLFERRRGQIGMRVLDISDHSDRTVPLPEVPSVVSPHINFEYDTSRYRYRYESMTTPPTVMELDIASLESVRIHEQPVPNYLRTNYRTERREAEAPDGTKIPISLVYRADLDLYAGPHQTILYGYGAYGITMEPTFSQLRTSLLDRGVIYAIAHVRGGGFLGRDWYEQGKFEHKQNTFTDFIAVARSLIDAKLTSPERLAMWGGSAGGLLVGAVANQASELFRAVVAEVPFVDVVTTMLDTSLPLTCPEWEEWGDPRDERFFRIMYSYSPYDNVKEKPYPDILAIAALNDPRVQYWEPAKWIARLRQRATEGDFLLLTHMSAGHQGRSGRYGMLEDRALVFAWLLSKLSNER